MRTAAVPACWFVGSLLILSLTSPWTAVADGPGQETPAAAVESHWAYVKPQRPTLPDVQRTEWPRNPIDAFILARLEQAGLEPNPQAGKERLVRRVTLDLTGVPPTLEEIDAFLADDRPDAYERVVDRLLASPRYGERWAVPWLDAGRYADSNGYQRDGRREAWAYRDWVIRALNADMPFDQFTIEQIAGDLLPGDSPPSEGGDAPDRAALQRLIATGFHRATMANVEAGTDPEEEHVLAVIDRVNTTGTVWLGTTIECAQCHNHKYDPFTQEEYYRLYAFFNNTEKEIETDGSERDFAGPKIELPLPPEQQQRRGRLAERVAAVRGRMDALKERLLADLSDWEYAVTAMADGSASAEEFPETIRKILALPAEKRSKKQERELEQHFLAQSQSYRKLEQRLKRIEARLSELEPPTTLVMKELPEPRTTRIFKRGDFLNPGEAVQPGTPSVLHWLPDDPNPNRLTLARWLVSEENPLTARVIVNRQWAEFFGRGLVETLEDFGTQGERPTHPDLLDWLAVEFMRGSGAGDQKSEVRSQKSEQKPAGGNPRESPTTHQSSLTTSRAWSLKRLHRLIVTSATYRQSAKATPELLARDSYNALYARGPRRRLTAEFVRDNALAVSGLLRDKMHGPPVFPYQPPGVWNHIGRASNVWETSSGEDLYRRGLYVYWRRTVPYPSFINFDAPSREVCTVQRPVSNTPLQALTLLNDPAYFEMAAALAGRMLAEVPPGSSIEDRVTYGFRLATSRRPEEIEVSILTNRYQTELERYRADPAAAKKLAAKWTKPEGADPAEFAAWVHVANVLLNLDEVITR